MTWDAYGYLADPAFGWGRPCSLPCRLALQCYEQGLGERIRLQEDSPGKDAGDKPEL